LTPGIVISSSHWRANGAICCSIAAESRSIASSRKSMWARICPDDQRVLAVKAALERVAQSGDLLAQLPARELGQRDRVGRAGDERIEHVAAGLAHDVAGHAAELDPGVLEDLVQARGLALAVVDLRLAIAGQIAQRADRLWRHQARPEQPGLDELA
jgi:hypothetical protein